MRILIIDDDEIHNERLRTLLQLDPAIRAVDCIAPDGVTAERIEAFGPTLFMATLGERTLPLVIDPTTDETALPTIALAPDHGDATRAFDIGVIDYLIKPVEDHRVTRALRRVARLSPASTDSPFRRTIAVKIGDRIHPLDVADVDCLVASGPYVDLFAAGKRYTIRASLSSLEAHLDPAEFLRVHRSAIVRLRSVKSIKRLPGGDSQLQMTGGITIRASRAHRSNLSRVLGLRP